jgi:hypothetical protein
LARPCLPPGHACEGGLVNAVVPDVEPMRASLALAGRIALGGPRGSSTTRN